MRERPSRAQKQRKCRQCGKDYEAKWGDKDWCCSDQCKVRSRSTVDEKSGCWLGEGKPDKWGYIRIQLGSRREGNRRKMLLHRFSYEAFVGPIPEGELLQHICDAPRCCSPFHLVPGSDADNMADAARKGRKRKKLTPGQIHEIRRQAEAGVPVATIAKQCKVSWSMVYKILRGEVWQHVKEQP